MTWYKKILLKHKKEVFQSAISSLFVTFLFSLWYFTSGKNFEWHTITPISQPSIFERYFYSAFTFATVGTFLFRVVKLWKGIYFVCVKILGSWKLNVFVKSLVWVALMGISYLYIVPAVVDILNAVISFFYNILILLLYLFPIFGFFVFGSVSVYYGVLYFKRKRWFK